MTEMLKMRPIVKTLEYKKRVSWVAAKLPEKSDAEWLVAVYVSLATAEALGYKRDSNARLSRKRRDQVNILMLSRDSLQFPASSRMERTWLGGHFFNNALFRIVALAQISLRTLFLPGRELKARGVGIVRWWIAGISATLSAVAIMYAAGQVKSQVRRRWFVIGMTLLVTSISILVFPRWAK